MLLSRTSGSVGHPAVKQTRNQPPLWHSDLREDPGSGGWGVGGAPSRPTPARKTSLVDAQGGADSKTHPRALHSECHPSARPAGHVAEPARTGGPPPQPPPPATLAAPSCCSPPDVISGRRSAVVGTRNREDVSDAGAFQFARGADAVYGELRG